MRRLSLNILDGLAYALLAFFALDRLLKLFAVIHFFRRPRPSPPLMWPRVTLLQPITRGTNSLHEALRARGRLRYPIPIQHLLICDASDAESQSIVSAYLDECPALTADLVLVSSEGVAVASKLRKLQTALPRATGDVLCFVDDDVILRPDTLPVLIPHLFQPAAGVAFGLPCFTNWQTLWSSLISGLINAHVTLSFVALTYLSDPFRMNGHIFAFRRATFEALGGLAGLEQHIDDEYEIARRVRQHGFRTIQTPLIYDIDNALPSYRAYIRQFKRWFVMPRQSMFPSLSFKDRLVATLSSMTLPLPSILALLALFTRRRSTLLALNSCLLLFAAIYALCEQCYLQHRTPLRRWPLLPVIAIWSPLQIIGTMLLSNEVEWRGQRLRLLRDGTAEIIS